MAKEDDAKRFAFAQKRNAERGSCAPDRGKFGMAIFHVSDKVRYMDNTPLQGSSTGDATAASGELGLAQLPVPVGIDGRGREIAVTFPFADGDSCEFGAAELLGRAAHGIEHRL
jgi:hypothetical protein